MPLKTNKKLTEKLSRLLDRLGEYNADLDQLLSQADEVYQQSMHGVPQEKVSVKDGVLTVIEKYPQIAIQAVKTKLEIVKTIVELTSEVTDEPTVNLTFQLVSLEEDLANSEDADASEFT